MDAGHLDGKHVILNNIVNKSSIKADSVFTESSGNHFIGLQSLMLCDIIIVAHSSFSWWAAYLSESYEIYAPRNLYAPGVSQIPEKLIDDYYPSHWSLLSGNTSEDRIVGRNPYMFWE